MKLFTDEWTKTQWTQLRKMGADGRHMVALSMQYDRRSFSPEGQPFFKELSETQGG